MKKTLLMLFFTVAALQVFAQKNNPLIINNETISNTLNGKWELTNAQPNTNEVLYAGFELKGVGYGEVTKKGDTKSAPIISKITANNNTDIVFSDAEGIRTSYKIESMSKTVLVLSVGKSILTYTKK